MAIERYYFSQASISANAEDVRQWIESSGYFDNVEIDTTEYGTTATPAIICSVGDTAKVQFCTKGDLPNGSTSIQYSGVKVTLASGYSYEKRASTSAYIHPICYYGIKTNYGIVIYFNSNYIIIVTKSDKDTVAVLCKWYSGNSNYHLYGDLINSAKPNEVDFGSKTTSATLTSLAPLVFPSSCYTPNLYFMPFNQNINVVGEAIIGGEEYFSDGYFVLKA